MIYALLKTTVLLAIGLAANRCTFFTAAEKHLILCLTIFCLPLALLAHWLPGLITVEANPQTLVPLSEIELGALQTVVRETVAPMTTHPAWQLNWSNLVMIFYLSVTAFLTLVWFAKLKITADRFSDRTNYQRLSSISHFNRVVLSESKEVASPLTFGVLSPAIVVPVGWKRWTLSERQSAICHELAHIKRQDTLIHILVGLVLCFFWWHPLIWISQRQIKLQAEVACDDIVINKNHNKVGYASLLLALARNERHEPAMAAPKTLPFRINSLLNQHGRHTPMNRLSKVRVAGAFALFCAPIFLTKFAIGAPEKAGLSPDGGVLPIVKVAPVYPPQAREAGVEGYVEVEFDINAQGKPENITVVDSEPAEIFDTAAVESISYYRYKPAVTQGHAHAVRGVRNRVTFKLKGGSSVEHPPVPAIDRAHFDTLSLAYDAIENKAYPDAHQILKGLKSLPDLNANEIAQIHNLAGFLAFKEGDYGRAIEEYKVVVSQPSHIPPGLLGTTLYTLAQLSFANTAYDKSLEYMTQWKRQAKDPGPIPLIFISQANYKLNNYPQAIIHLEQGLLEADQRSVEIRENWWLLLAHLYHEEGRWSQTLETLEKLNEFYPKDKYTDQIRALRKRVESEGA
ncbi:MAG: TonB family protein [Pseudomonadota bacterium]